MDIFAGLVVAAAGHCHFARIGNATVRAARRCALIQYGIETMTDIKLGETGGPAGERMAPS